MKKFKQFIAGTLCGALMMTTVPAVAKVGKQAISVVYNNIKLEVNGVKTTMSAGIEPFVYNGTTYLPVRAVAEALGEKVEYDKTTSTVYVGSRKEKPVNGSISLIDYVSKKPIYDGDGIRVSTQTTNIYGDLSNGKQFVTSNQNTYGYDSILYCHKRSGYNAPTVKLRLDSNFKTLKGKLLIGDVNNDIGSGMLIINSVNAKGEVLEELYSTDQFKDIYGTPSPYSNYEVGHTMGGFNPIELNIDLTGVDIISIQMGGNAYLLDPILMPLS